MAEEQKLSGSIVVTINPAVLTVYHDCISYNKLRHMVGQSLTIKCQGASSIFEDSVTCDCLYLVQ